MRYLDLEGMDFKIPLLYIEKSLELITIFVSNPVNLV